LDINPTFGVFFMAKHDARFKVEVVKQYLSGNSGYQEVATTSGVEPSQLRRWVASYRLHGVSGLEKKYSTYSAEFRLEILQRIAREGLSDRQAAALYDIRSTADIGKWRRQYDGGGLGALGPRRKGRLPMAPKPPLKAHPPHEPRTQKELLEELAYLRAENAYLKKLKALSDAERNAALVKKRK